jgi:DNA-binding transcriptional LysR family regulator
VRRGLEDALAELRDKSAGRLSIGANESSILYLLPHLERFRRLFPKIKVQARRSQSSKIPAELLHGDLELGVVSYDPGDDQLVSKVIFTDALTFVVSPEHRLAHRKSVTIGELGQETFIAHNVVSPYREAVLREFRRHKVPLNMDVEMPTLETIRRFVQSNEGVAFLPRMCVQRDVERGLLREVTVKELHVERKVRLLHAKTRTLSHAARAFLDVVQGHA